VNNVYCTPFIGALCACVYETAARERVWVAEGYAMTTHSKARLAENLGGWGVGEGRLCKEPFPYLAFFSPFSWRNKKRAKSFSTKKHHPYGGGSITARFGRNLAQGVEFVGIFCYFNSKDIFLIFC
jgi:hypothetical protein